MNSKFEYSHIVKEKTMEVYGTETLIVTLEHYGKKLMISLPMDKEKIYVHKRKETQKNIKNKEELMSLRYELMQDFSEAHRVLFE
jgi:hypothetical protein